MYTASGRRNEEAMHPAGLALVFAVAAGKRRRSKLPNGSNLAIGGQTAVFAIRQFIADCGRSLRA